MWRDSSNLQGYDMPETEKPARRAGRYRTVGAPFDDAEKERVELAWRRAGYKRESHFVRDVILQRVDEILTERSPGRRATDHTRAA